MRDGDIMEKKTFEELLKEEAPRRLSKYALKFWDEYLILHDGWFIYISGNKASIVSLEWAKRKEEHYCGYQAEMSADRGGAEVEKSFLDMGFRKISPDADPNQMWNYEYADYLVERWAEEAYVRPIEDELVIPKVAGIVPINHIESKAFMGCDIIKKVVIHEHIKAVEFGAFKDCKNLSNVVVRSSNTKISSDAFLNTPFYDNIKVWQVDGSLLKINGKLKGKFEVDKNITRIESDVFIDCNELEEIVLPDNLVSIGNNVFSGCKKLKKVILPESLKIIGTNAFAGCKNLEKIEIPKHVKRLGMAVFAGCVKLKALEIPNGVEELGASLLSDCKNLESVSIPNVIKSIPDGMFKGCERLHSLKLHDGITYIGSEAFRGCKNLSNINIPESVERIGEKAFADSGILEKIKNTNEKAFYIDNWLIDLEKDYGSVLHIKDGTVGIADAQDSFTPSRKNINEIIFPGTMRYVGKNSLQCLNVESLVLPEGLLCIYDDAFEDGKMKEIEVPKSVKYVGFGAFSTCENIEKVVFKNPKTKFGDCVVSDRTSGERPIEIWGYKNSTAEQYCREHEKIINLNLVFRSID